MVGVVDGVIYEKVELDRLDPGLEHFFLAIVVLWGAKVKFLCGGRHWWVLWGSGYSWWGRDRVFFGRTRLLLVGVSPQRCWVGNGVGGPAVRTTLGKASSFVTLGSG